MTLSTGAKVAVGLAVLYTATVLGTRTTTIAAIGTHEAMHSYWEGTGTVRFKGNPTQNLVLTGESDVRGGPGIPHIIPKAAGWLVAGALLLPLVLAGRTVYKG